MAKIAFDKYYTSPRTARFCINKVIEVIGKDNITEWIEPSAGCGTFSLQIPDCYAYDLYPQHPSIRKADFTTLDLGGYKKGRLFIGNPPFGGSSGKLIQQFFNKCAADGDYIAFILPVGYYDSYARFNKFEIIYQTTIEIEYTNVMIKSAFIIYKRNPMIQKFKDPEPLKAIKWIRLGRENKKDKKHKSSGDYDYCVASFGTSLKECKPYEHAGTYAMKIDQQWREQVKELMKWLYWYNKETKILSQFSVSSPSINLVKLDKLIRICLPGIE